MSPLQRTLEPEVMDTEAEAADYDSMDHSGPNEAFVQRLIELGARGRMLDIGTGPGHIPLLVCAQLAQVEVTGIDLSQRMLERAQAHRARSPHAARLQFRLADAKRIDAPDGAYDTVFSNTILHHIPDPRPFLREAARVLRPGGVLLIRDLLRPQSAGQALELVRQHAAGASAHQQELFRASLHAALTPEELRALADECGLASARLSIDSDRHMSLQIGAARHAAGRMATL